MLVGDFNHFKTPSIQRQYGLKQIAKLPTRGSKTLHEILTNLSQYYTNIAKFAPFGLSDQCTVVAKAGDRPKKEPTSRTVRDLRPSNKVKLGSCLKN